MTGKSAATFLCSEGHDLCELMNIFGDELKFDCDLLFIF